jgi:UDP-sugar diphosphatase
VAILLYHKSKNAFVLVKQFRPPVFVKNGDGFTYELCAGILDKDISSAKTVQEEIFEETGYEVKVEDIEKVTEFYTSVGSAGAKQELFYAEIDDENKVHNGGGVDVEDIEVVYLDVGKLDEFIFDTTKVKTPGLMFAFKWCESFKK